jgi:5S rRNA maturation endonuclease (ribonuclease M5)
MSQAVHNLLSKLRDVRKTGTGWQAKCPAHEDNKASLAVSIGENGGAVCYCHAGCETQAVVDAIGLKLADLMPESSQSPSHATAKPRIVCQYDYHDEQGRLLYQALRFEPKDFRQRAPDGQGGWEWRLNGARRVLYRLPELIAADPRETVYVVEGEKDADRLRSLGLVATCNVGGAGKWRDEYNEPLRGRHVVILPDNDEPGRKHAQQVSASLQGIAASVKTIELPGLSAKGDVSDWLDAGHTVEELAALVRRVKDPNAIEYRRITCAELDASDYGIEFLVDRTLVARQPCIIAGSKKTLKTSLIVDLGISIATAGFFLGKLKVNRAARVAIMSGESGLGTLQETARRVARAAGRELRDIEGLIWSDSLPRFGNPLHTEALRSFLTADEIEVVIVDPAYLCMPTDGNEASLFAMGDMLRGISELCQEIGATLILCHHTKKGVVDPFAPAELEDIAWAGFSEFCRQWLLVSRRQKYEPGTGQHKLWLNCGGSAGHSALWALDIDEGVYDGHAERYWEVNLTTADEARQDATTDREREREAAKEAQRKARLDADRKTVIAAMVRMREPQTMRFIRDTLGFSGARIGTALGSLVQTEDVIAFESKKGGQIVTLYKIPTSDLTEGGTSGTA